MCAFVCVCVRSCVCVCVAGGCVVQTAFIPNGSDMVLIGTSATPDPETLIADASDPNVGGEAASMPLLRSVVLRVDPGLCDLIVHALDPEVDGQGAAEAVAIAVAHIEYVQCGVVGPALQAIVQGEPMGKLASRLLTLHLAVFDDECVCSACLA